MEPIWYLVAILFAGILILAVISRGAPKSSKKRSASSAARGSVDREFVSRKWAAIEIMASGTGSSLKDAVSEADKLLDYVMKHQGIRGTNMGERLKNHSGRFSDVNEIWSAHKLRNALAHEADFDLVPSQAREAIKQFERGLKDLGAI